MQVLAHRSGACCLPSLCFILAGKVAQPASCLQSAKPQLAALLAKLDTGLDSWAVLPVKAGPLTIPCLSLLPAVLL